MSDAYTVDDRQEKINALVGASHGDFDTVKTMLASDPSLLNENAIWVETPIEAAAQMARRDIMEFLIAAGASVDICTAAVLGDMARVSSLLGGQPDLAHATGAHGIPVLYYPASGGYPEIAELLLSRGADVNAGSGRSTPLHGAAEFGQSGMVAWLLDNGADIDAPGYEGKTALATAEEGGHTEVANLLRQRGAKG